MKPLNTASLADFLEETTKPLPPGAKSVTELIDTDLREYSMYVLENRALPSLVDGLKPVQRKIIYVTDKVAKKEFKKIAELAASLASMANYHHGEASASSATVLMGAEYANNVCLIEGKGLFGSRLVPEAAAPRYIFGRMSKNYEKYFKDDDIAPIHPDVDNPEPAYYLPIIPWVLVNGAKGIAVGFAVEIQPRNPKDLVKACIHVLEKNTPPKNPVPWFWNFNGEYGFDDERKTHFCRGKFEWTKKNKIMITELPIDVSRESYVKFLCDLEDENKIQNFEDHCAKAGFKFEITVNPQQRAVIEKKGEIAYFKLQKYLNENINVISQEGKLKQYDAAPALIQDFVHHRLGFYQKRIDTKLKELQERIDFLEDLNVFVKLVLDDKIRFKNRKKDQIIADCLSLKVMFADRHITRQIQTLTEESIAENRADIKNLQEELAYYKKITPKELYLKELREL